MQIPAGKALPAPPVGPALGQRGLNIMEFCKAFNAATQSFEVGLPIPVIITAYADKSFTFVLKVSPATSLIMRTLQLAKGSDSALVKKVGRLTKGQCEDIAKTKMSDLTAGSLVAAMKTIAGSARSMGVTVEEF